MKVGVEFDFVIKDSLQALEIYQQIFDLEEVVATNFPRGENEVIFTLYGLHFHMLDENPKFHLHAPDPDATISSWINVTVPNIKETYEKALELGCTEIQPITKIDAMGISNAIFKDPFGYIWMLHQIHREVSKEEMMEFWENQRENN